MSDLSILREYLISLGFKVDAGGWKRFESGVGHAAKVVTEAAAVIEAASAAVDLFVVKLSENLDNLYWASIRIHSSVTNIKGYQYAISQLGGTAGGARQALEGIALFMRSNPGAENFLQRIGVTTRNQHGELLDTERILESLATQLRGMPYYRARLFAQVLGIDDITLQAMLRGVQGFSREYQELARRLGVNLDDSARNANRFQTNLRELNAEVGLLVTKIGGDLIERWGPRVREFMIWLADHSQEIAARLEVWADRIARLGIALFNFAMKAIDWFDRLDRATDGWSTTIIALLALLQVTGAGGLIGALFNLGGAAGALGPEFAAAAAAVVALAVALGALVVDYNRWKAGKSSIIDWGPLDKQIQDLGRDMGELMRTLGQFAKEFGPLVIPVLKGIVETTDEAIKGLTHLLKMLISLKRGDLGAALAEAVNAAKAGDISNLFPQGAPQPSAPARPGTPAAPAGAPVAAGANTDVISRMLAAAGIAPEKVRGIIAGMAAESRLDPNAVNPTSGAFGLGQWLGDRKRALFRMFGPRPNLQQQVQFLISELRGGDRGGAAVLAAPDAMSAMEAYITRFMRPGAGAAGDLSRGRDYLAGGPELVTHHHRHSVTIHQRNETHIHGGVHGVTMDELKGELGPQQTRSNADLLRNLKSAHG